ncbi:uncharacterized protein LAJ45_06207 [Morchella importuna]|uniref:uncharacterized protein n=1 Tax=Morchella importuna TaxID=1174673 RepID=UPI001E8CAFCC|nr:uncharacterized protein LAJ45_06207 [Morchella importuna]KAH8149578.1 hypothetical protein LAJ45_06207 [Morchella importuna]
MESTLQGNRIHVALDISRNTLGTSLRELTMHILNSDEHDFEILKGQKPNTLTQPKTNSSPTDGTGYPGALANFAFFKAPTRQHTSSPCIVHH